MCKHINHDDKDTLNTRKYLLCRFPFQPSEWHNCCIQTLCSFIRSSTVTTSEGFGLLFGERDVAQR